MGNYTVTIALEVRAESATKALDQTAEALRKGFKGSGIAPVADFKVAEGAPNLLDKLPANT